MPAGRGGFEESQVQSSGAESRKASKFSTTFWALKRRLFCKKWLPMLEITYPAITYPAISFVPYPYSAFQSVQASSSSRICSRVRQKEFLSDNAHA